MTSGADVRPTVHQYTRPLPTGPPHQLAVHSSRHGAARDVLRQTRRTVQRRWQLLVRLSGFAGMELRPLAPQRERDENTISVCTEGEIGWQAQMGEDEQLVDVVAEAWCSPWCNGRIASCCDE